MTRAGLILLCLVCLTGTCREAYAHPVPFTYIDVHPEPGVVDISVVMHTFDVARDLCPLAADGATLQDAVWSAPEAVPDRQSIRVRARFPLLSPAGRIEVRT